MLDLVFVVVCVVFLAVDVNYKANANARVQFVVLQADLCAPESRLRKQITTQNKLITSKLQIT